MLKHKYTNIIAFGIVLFAIVGVLLLIYFGDSFLISYDTSTASYKEKIFDDSYVHTIDIVVDEEDFQDMIDNAADKEYIITDLVIDDETFSNVAIRTKGNSSLRDIVTMDDSDRYSFKIEFDHYDDNFMYYGLDKLTLNNCYQDPTYLKDYIAYDMMESISISSPCASYVYITVNGEDWGLYIAVEGVEDSFLETNYESSDGNLYKPESTMDLANAGQKDQNMMNENMNQEELTIPEDMENMPIPEGMEEGIILNDENMPIPDENMMPGEMPEMGDENVTERPARPNNTGEQMMPELEGDEKITIPNEDNTNQEKIPNNLENNDEINMINNRMKSNMNSTSNGADLSYTDDEYDSYSDIFDNAKTDISNSDKDALINALEVLSTGENLETVIDIDSVIDYFVVHNYLLNYDSYTGNMLHNYYLYEEDGILSMIPWDYNLSLGTFISNNNETATEYVNYAIDTPTSVDITTRPLLYQLLNNDKYLEEYHNSFGEFIDSYFTSGYFEGKIDQVIEMISPYVEKDQSAFYTYEEFIEGSSTFKEFCLLRAESIQGQLDGTIPSITEEQENSDFLINADYIIMSTLGSKKLDE